MCWKKLWWVKQFNECVSRSSKKRLKKQEASLAKYFKFLSRKRLQNICTMLVTTEFWVSNFKLLSTKSTLFQLDCVWCRTKHTSLHAPYYTLFLSNIFFNKVFRPRSKVFHKKQTSWGILLWHEVNRNRSTKCLEKQSNESLRKIW